MADKVEEYGTVTAVYVSGMCDLDSGKRIPAKLGATTFKKGDKIIKEDGALKIAPKAKRTNTAQKQKAAAKVEQPKVENEKSIDGGDASKEQNVKQKAENTPEAAAEK